MKSEMTWYEFSKDDPNELVGRYVRNAFGCLEVVTMPRISWAYLDWLHEHGAAIPEFIKSCDRSNLQHSLGEALQAWTYWALEDNDRDGFDRPPWLLDEYIAETP